MSVIVKARLLWVLPLALVGSWLTVRTLAASTIVADEPLPASAMPSPVVVPEVNDPALASMIGRFAAQARSQ